MDELKKNNFHDRWNFSVFGQIKIMIVYAKYYMFNNIYFVFIKENLIRPEIDFDISLVSVSASHAVESLLERETEDPVGGNTPKFSSFILFSKFWDNKREMEKDFR